MMSGVPNARLRLAQLVWSRPAPPDYSSIFADFCTEDFQDRRELFHLSLNGPARPRSRRARLVVICAYNA